MQKSTKATGFCPQANLHTDIDIDYVERVDGKFDKQRFSCKLMKSGFDCKSANKCQIYHNAPQIIS